MSPRNRAEAPKFDFSTFDEVVRFWKKLNTTQQMRIANVLYGMAELHLNEQVRWSTLYKGKLNPLQQAADQAEHDKFVAQAGISVRGSTHSTENLGAILTYCAFDLDSPLPINIPLQMIIAFIHDLGETATPVGHHEPVGDVASHLKAKDPLIQIRETAIVMSMLRNEKTKNSFLFKLTQYIPGNSKLSHKEAEFLIALYRMIVAKTDFATTEETGMQALEFARSAFDLAERLDYLSTGLHTIRYLKIQEALGKKLPQNLQDLAVIATISSLAKVCELFTDKLTFGSKIWLKDHQVEILGALEFLRTLPVVDNPTTGARSDEVTLFIEQLPDITKSTIELLATVQKDLRA